MNKKHKLPARFIKIINNLLGADGEKWLAELPQIIGEIAENWSLTVEKPFAGLSYNYVAPCFLADGTPAVLKIGIPGEDNEFLREARTLQLLDGTGCVKLLNLDEPRRAMLLEKLLPGENLTAMCETEDERATNIAIGLMREIWREPPAEHKFKTLESWIKNFDEWEIEKFPPAFPFRAKKLFAELNGQNAKKFLLHGDLHHENILSAQREPYLIIDPKGIVGEIGYEIGVFMNDPPELIVERENPRKFLENRLLQFAEAFQIDPNTLNQWAIVQAILSSWWTFDEQDDYWRELLQIVEIREQIKFS